MKEVEIEGLDHVRNALRQGSGVLITPNHPSHADPFALLVAADRLRSPFYFMTAWQVFVSTHLIGRRVLESHGCFSINRETYDLGAFRRAVDVLQNKSQPLVIFPEGDVYHLNDRTMPFRHGAAVAALLASQRGNRPVACVPCALKFQFTSDPSHHLNELTDKLEHHLKIHSSHDMPLAKRIERMKVTIVAESEQTYFGRVQNGSLAERIEALMRVIMGRLEFRYGVNRGVANRLDRIMQLRQRVLSKLARVDKDPIQSQQCQADLQELFVAGQLVSYPGDYLSHNPSVERLAETLDKLEEDVLKVKTASSRGSRRAVVKFSEPIVVSGYDDLRTAAAGLTDVLQSRVQGMLDEFHSTEFQSQTHV
ncbi:MAG: lysophospholipid acyltransferase family protein [Bythopirellula sp.]